MRKYESWWTYENYTYNFGVKLLIAADIPKNTGTIDLYCSKICKEIENRIILLNKETIYLWEKQTKQLLDCFPCKYTFQEIKNQYAHPDDVAPPWLKVFTYKGVFIIGWRKHVIHIEWEDSSIKETAEMLFPKENVTKYNKIIHAWGLEKAKEYLKVLCD